MSWSFYMSGPSLVPQNNTSTPEPISTDLLVQHAEEWLGPNKSFKDLELWEQRALLTDIEADLLQLRLQTIYEVDTY